jgi:RHS repeat-associated protein
LEAPSANRPSVQPIEQSFRFRWQQLAEKIGLHYNRFCYYDPAIGVLLRGGGRLYFFAPNPGNWVDVFGLSPCPTRAQVIAATTALLKAAQ